MELSWDYLQQVAKDYGPAWALALFVAWRVVPQITAAAVRVGAAVTDFVAAAKKQGDLNTETLKKLADRQDAMEKGLPTMCHASAGMICRYQPPGAADPK